MISLQSLQSHLHVPQLLQKLESLTQYPALANFLDTNLSSTNTSVITKMATQLPMTRPRWSSRKSTCALSNRSGEVDEDAISLFHMLLSFEHLWVWNQGEEEGSTAQIPTKHRGTCGRIALRRATSQHSRRPASAGKRGVTCIMSVCDRLEENQT